jgi:hypothetical protein
MEAADVIEAVREYLDLLGREPLQGRALPVLARALDRLALAYHDTESMVLDDTDTPDPPSQDYRQLRDQAVRCFPELGYYHTPSSLPLEIESEATLTLGDGIDDVADITGELTQIVWRWENNGSAEAVWYFRLGYESHWGRHLHDLRGYLHTLIFESKPRLQDHSGAAS